MSKKKPQTIRMPKSLDDAYSSLPISKSAAVSLAVMAAEENTAVLGRALMLRIESPTEPVDSKTCITVDDRVKAIMERLADMTKLPMEQAVRLAMEAYIHKL